MSWLQLSIDATESQVPLLELLFENLGAVAVTAEMVGAAEAALTMTSEYAKERIQGGAPIIEHQSVKLRLFEMFRKVEAARALARRVIFYNATSTAPQLHYAIASKVTSTQTAFEVASEALQMATSWPA